MSGVVKFPQPQKCSFCDHVFVGAVCNLCKRERPTFTAMKSITAAARGVAPLKDPKRCRYFPNSICGCEQRGTCLPAA